MPFLQSIKNITSSTESKIKNATNTEPLGPYNHELTELARLTFSKKHLSIIISIINKRLKPLLQLCNTSTPMKRSKTSISSRRSSTSLKRSNSSPSTPTQDSTKQQQQQLDSKTYLSLLKTLTVILYILQNGSVPFIDWLLREYPTSISPLLTLAYPSKYKESIRHKIHKIISLLEEPESLNNYRINIHKLRTDMLSPGMKRTSLDGVDLLQVEHQPEVQPLRIRTPPLMERLKSISEHNDDNDADSNYTFSNDPPRKTSGYQTFPHYNYHQNNDNSTTLSNPHQLSPIF
ncbi:hypothetical protein SBY92_000472 [Candida maltosa Xu316]|uniref:ENTH domain-containing protein n=1 Tax=Candida maltosa (strain Xu316) TaxID=1245528 RepID=M3JAH8_CANMX|nr:hypothetical protein G210_0208 [Candida maltosa Xu316]